MAAITPLVLLPAEQEIVAATERGDRAELSDKPEDERCVRASFLRDLLLGLPVVREGDGARPGLVRLPGIRVRGARIEDTLGLQDCAGPEGGGLPGLALEDCDIGAGIDLTNARLARLSLKGSRIGEVRMRGARLDGPFDFSAVRPASDAPDAPAWIDARGCAIRAEVVGDAAKLRVPPKCAKGPLGQVRYALNLSDSIIDGGLRLLGKVEAIGGVTIADTRIRGDLYGIDARMEAGKGNALNAQAARIDGVVALDGLTASGKVWMPDIRIGSTLLLDGADLKNSEQDGSDDALVAEGAEIGGGVLLRNGFTAEGRVSFLGAKIGGSIECDGAHFANRTEDGSGDAIAAENAEIGGDVLLRNGFTAGGCVSLRAVKIGGNLECEGGHFANRTKNGRGDAIAAQNAEIGGDVLLHDGFTAQGRVSLHGAKIRGNLECGRAHLVNRTNDGKGHALLAQSAEIGGDMFLHDEFTAEGCVSLHGAKIGGNLQCSGGHFANRTENGKGRSLVAEGAEIVGAVLLHDGFTAEGRVVLLNAKMGSFSCRSATLCNSSPDTAAITLNLVNATIAGRARLEVVSIGRISLRGCRVGGNLNCTGGTFVTWSRSYRRVGRWDSALDATNLTAGGDVVLDRVTVLGSLVFEHAEITGGLRWDGIRFPRSVEVRPPVAGSTSAAWSYSGRVDATTANPVSLPLPQGTDVEPAAQIVLAHARIGAALQAHELAAEVPLLIDLSAASAYTLDDIKDGDASHSAAGWGGDGRDGKTVPRLDLDGFVYQRIETIAGSRLDWLRRQNVARDGAFFPQPYRHLATVLRAQGHLQEARMIAIAEQDATPYGPWSLFRHVLFGRCFGYGLSPVRASITLGLMLAIGTALVWTAWKQPILVLTADREAALSVKQQLADMHIKIGERPCGKHEIQPLFYAVDMMLPVIPLHQEDRCEVAARPGTEIWQIAWAVFSILGKIVTSLALITYSGVLKPRDE